MTIEKIRERLLAIDNVKGDNEIAHGMEKRLLKDYIKSLLKRDDEIGVTAREVLKVEDIEFDRWYA